MIYQQSLNADESFSWNHSEEKQKRPRSYYHQVAMRAIAEMDEDRRADIFIMCEWLLQAIENGEGPPRAKHWVAEWAAAADRREIGSVTSWRKE